MIVSPKDWPVEHSDDRRRGALPHVTRAISQLLGLRGTPCSRCRKPVTSPNVIDSRFAPRTLCGACVEDWRRFTWEQRIAERAAYARRRRS